MNTSHRTDTSVQSQQSLHGANAREAAVARLLKHISKASLVDPSAPKTSQQESLETIQRPSVEQEALDKMAKELDELKTKILDLEHKVASFEDVNSLLVEALGTKEDEHAQLVDRMQQLEKKSAEMDDFVAYVKEHLAGKASIMDLCHDENRRTLMRSALITMNYDVGLPEDRMEVALDHLGF